MHPDTSRRERLGLLVLFGIALLLRLTGIDGGLPGARHLFPYHPDEPTLVMTAHQMALRGDWNPRQFNYGCLTFDLFAGLLKAADGLGLLSLRAPDWGVAYLLARVLVALLGVATVGVAYALGRRLGGRRLGFAAAGWLAVMPLHVVHSHYATVDVPLALWTLLALGCLIRWRETPGWRWAAAFGTALGLGAATKYNAAALWLVAAPVLGLPWRELRSWVAAGGAFAGAFLLVSPYAVLDAPAFLQDLLFEMRHARVGGTLDFAATPPGWWYHLVVGLPTGMGVLGTVLAAAGLVWMLARRDPRWWILAGAALVQYAVIGASAEKFVRYLMPLLPLFALGGAGLALEGAARAGWRRALVALPTVVLAGNLGASLAFGLLLARPDARDRAAEWAERHIPPGSRVGLGEIPSFFTPPLWPYNGGRRTQALLEGDRERLRYPYVVTGWDADRLRAETPDWFVLSEFEIAPRLRLARPADLRFWEALRDAYELVWRDKPLPCLGPVCFQRRNVPHDWRYPNPEIRVYRRRVGS